MVNVNVELKPTIITVGSELYTTEEWRTRALCIEFGGGVYGTKTWKFSEFSEFILSSSIPISSICASSFSIIFILRAYKILN